MHNIAQLHIFLLVLQRQQAASTAENGVTVRSSLFAAT